MVNKLFTKVYIVFLILSLIVNLTINAQINEDNINNLKLLNSIPSDYFNAPSYWFNQDGSLVAIYQLGILKVVDTETLQILDMITIPLTTANNAAENQPEIVNSVGFILNSQSLTIGTSAGPPFKDFGNLYQWNILEENTLQSVRDTISIDNITVSFDGMYLSYTQRFDEVVLMDAYTKEVLSTFRVDGRFGGHPIFSYSDSVLAVVLQDGFINLINLDNANVDSIPIDLVPHDTIFSPSGNILASWNDHAIELWNVNTLQQVFGFEISSDTEDFIIDIDINNLEDKLAIGGSQLSSDRNLVILDMNTGDIFAPNDSNAPIFSVAFHPINQLLASGARDGTVKIWDSENFDMPIYEIILDEAILSLDFSPNGNLIFIQTASELTIWGINNSENE